MWEISGNIFLGHLEGCDSQILPKTALDHGGCPDTFSNFCESLYNIQLKLYAISMVELFEIVVHCCYIGFCLKCGCRVPISDFEKHK